MVNNGMPVPEEVAVPPSASLSRKERLVLGAMGGVAAAASKIIGLDAKIASALVDWDMFSKASELKLMILIHTPILIILGAIMAYLIDESVRVKAFAIGVSAPALITPWLSNPVVDPGMLARAEIHTIGFVSSAWANDLSDSPAPDKAPSRIQGLEYLLGAGGINASSEQRFWVIVGSHADMTNATAQVDRIKAIAPSLQPFIGLRKDGNPFYPVILGGDNGFLPLAQARQLQSIAEETDGVAPNGAYLSAYANRLPANPPD